MPLVTHVSKQNKIYTINTFASSSHNNDNSHNSTNRSYLHLFYASARPTDLETVCVNMDVDVVFQSPEVLDVHSVVAGPVSGGLVGHAELCDELWVARAL